MTNKKQAKDYDTALIKRDAIFNSLFRFKDYLDNYDADTSASNEVKLRYQKFQLLWNQFDSIQTDTEVSSPRPSVEQDKRQEFEDVYFELATQAELIISKQIVNTPSKQDKLKESSDDTGIKFQPISIPKFNGNYEDWLSFSDLFKAMIHNNDKIPIIKKFYCLRSSLTGVAEGVIKNIEVTEANYLGAWELLEQRFHNTKLITEKHVKSLFDLPKLGKESGKELRHLLDNFQKHLQALQALNQPIKSWDTLLIHLLSNKLDSETFKAWQEHAPAKELPNLENLIQFLLKRCQMLESLPNKQTLSHNNTTQYSKSISKSKSNQFYNKSYHKSQQSNNACFHTQPQPTCALCKRQHYLFKCSEFLNLSVIDRKKKVKELKLCENCLKSGHIGYQCVSRHCSICKSFHNTLLHDNNQIVNNQLPENSLNNNNSSTVVHAINRQSVTKHDQVILSTAVVNIINKNGQRVPFRILLDCGSQSNFITESACNLLGLKRQKTSVPITGINATSTQVSQRVTATVCSTISDFSFNIEFLVIPKVTNNIPSKSLITDSWEFPSNIPIADPSWNSPGSIDALIGAGHFWDLIQSERVNIENSCASLQETKLGYIICSSNETSNINHSSLCHLTTLDELDDHIQSFWKIEEFSNNSKVYTGEDLACEIHYKNTVSRDHDGRYIVEIPFKQDPSKLGDSRENAFRQFRSLESKLVKNPCLYQEYRNFMKEYQLLGHMEETDDEQQSLEYFLPHHAVVKESSTTTKLRVVFNASSKTSSGLSLNEMQMVGPTIQDSLFSILIRFRMSNYILIADIEKMYRQTWIHPSQTKFQKIFWRDSPADKLKTWKLLTITYGTASAPYLACRTLHQVFIDEAHDYPAIKDTEKDFYVDNYMTGCNTIQEGLQIQEQITSLLKRGGFYLRKWCSNSEQLLINIAPQDKEKLEVYHFEDHSAQTVKTLGLVFIPDTDQFIFISKPFNNNSFTKRSVISEIAQVYDPLGIIGPIILKAKSFMQQLWRLGIGWDETLPETLLYQWTQFRQSFSNLESMKIPRQVTINPLESTIEIHAFSDSSEQAYGTCIYIRNIDNHGRTLGVQLLCSKSRVAPLKSTSLPRLELSAALLMGQLVHSVKSALNITEENIFYWTDSTIVLAWLSAASSNWATYVANRVAKIQDLTNINQWHHVNGTQNPADIISRGMDVSTLMKSTLWWHGPEFLHDDGPITFTNNFNDLENIPERKLTKSISLVTTSVTKSKFDILHKFSSWRKLIRVIAYCKRFIENSKIKNNSNQRQIGSLTLQEHHDATNIILKLLHQETFHNEIKLISSGKELPKDNKLLKLSPILDENNLIRVGGRIDNANVTINQKHPIILPSNHHITKLIATDYHIKQLHCGPQALLATIRLKYWPINGRFLVNNIVKSCVKCFRVKPSNVTQLMGQLPRTRVQPSRPFTHCGVDYAGPVLVRLNNLRKPIIGKAFISIFICFATKAIHIELVEDLSVESFISALRRFVARRGKPSCIYSDNSTTFKGSSNYLKELQQLLSQSATQETINTFTTSAGIEWSFIPPYSPNIGGLWEANIKLIKHHLRRTMGTRILNYVTLYTLLTEIEACVNSRPLVPLTNNPSDLSAITPAHFLIGDSLASILEHNQHLRSSNKLNKLKLIQEMKQHFWSRWSSEYLGELQKRSKWATSQPNLKIGMLVLIKNDNLPALKWKLGRIVELHQGTDNKVRIVSLRTEDGITTRSISKVCPLPQEDEEEDVSTPQPSNNNNKE